MEETEGPDVSVVIPTYNEGENIRSILEEVSTVLEGRDYEIIVVDDSSPDGTAEKAREAGNPDVRVIEREGKKGIGSAYRDGFREAEGGVVVQMDADFSHRPEDLPGLVEAVEDGADVAVGSRYVEGGERKDPVHRRVFPLMGSYMYRFLAGIPVKDVTSGFKAYSREVTEEVSDGELPDGYHFQAASLKKVVESGHEVVEVPIEFRPRREGEPKYSHRDLVDNALLLLKMSARERSRVLKFASVGATGVLVNMGLLFVLTEFAGLHYLVSAAVAVESSILSNFVLNDLWTFRGIGEEGVWNRLRRLSRFNAVSLVGMGINLSVLWALTELLGIYYLVSNLVAIAVVFTWNYLANVNWTW